MERRGAVAAPFPDERWVVCSPSTRSACGPEAAAPLQGPVNIAHLQSCTVMQEKAQGRQHFQPQGALRHS